MKLRSFILFISILNISFNNLLYSQKPEIIIPIGHTADVLCCAFSPDGKYLLSGGCDFVTILWDVATGKPLKTFRGHNGFINFISFSPDGNSFVSCSDDGTAKIWDIAGTQELVTFYAVKTNFKKACFSKDGKKLLLGEEGYNVYLYEISSKKILWQTINNKEIFGLRELSFALNDSKVFISSFENLPLIYDLKDGSEYYTLDYFGVYTLFPDQKTLLSSSGISDLSNSFITECSILENQNCMIPKLISSSVSINSWYKVSISNNGNRIAGLYENQEITLWDKNETNVLDSTPYEILTGYHSDKSVVDTDFVKMYNYRENVYSDFETKLLCIAISPDGQFLVAGGDDNIIRLFDANSGKLIRELKTYSTHVNSAIFSPDGNSIVQGSSDKSIKIWNFKDKVSIHSFNTDYAVSDLVYSKNKNHLLSVLGNESGDYIAEWDMNADTITKEYGIDFLWILWKHRPDEIFFGTATPTVNKIKSLCYMQDETSVLCLQNYNLLSLKSKDTTFYFKNKSGKILKMNLETINGDRNWNIHIGENYLKSYKGFRDNDVKKMSKLNYDFAFDPQNNLSLSPDNKYALTGSNFGRMILWDIEKREEIKTYKSLSETVTSVAFSPDGKSGLSGGNGKNEIQLWDIKSGKCLKEFIGHEGLIINLGFSPDGKTFFSNSTDNSVKIWDVNSGELIHTLKGHVRYPKKVSYSPDGKQLLSGSVDNTMKVWDVETGEEIVSLISIDSVDWLITSPDNYYFASKSALKLMSWKIGDKIYNFEQFDLQYNRPDIILERIGKTDSASIQILRKAYEKRLKKSGFNEKMFSPEWHTPVCKILNNNILNSSTIEPLMDVEICGTDSKYKLDRLNVWINDVPLYGINGFSLKAQNTDSVNKRISIALSPGLNKILVSFTNEKGVESRKESAEIMYNSENRAKPNLYLIVLSVSEYNDKQYNLQYAVKDGRDIVSLFSSLSISNRDFSQIIIDTLFNSNATKENFLNLKQKLLSSHIDDQVVVFVSGHGLLNKEMDFFFATYDMDFNEPDKRGISFDALESLLDSIPARKKLLLMDACHSGEVDKEDIVKVASNKLQTDENVKEYSTKGAQTAYSGNNSGIGLTNSFELMQELFANLDKGTGTIVISAAAGKGYALESPKWNNGVFTYSIINGLKYGAADNNNDRKITVSELKDYSIKEVEKLTNGKQKPTVRKEAIGFDWKIW